MRSVASSGVKVLRAAMPGEAPLRLLPKAPAPRLLSAVPVRLALLPKAGARP
ncbi:hypothetical protein [Amycolatopsis kentuckyensis]|uniref:hypothetical protein n=1 Tax=Amycolatopsis kentuckyensis TaxID=218823 RepID=UPI00356A39B6